jgi:hypothetical protein
MNAKKLPKGSKLSLITTEGLQPGNYPLYNLQGLSLGKLSLLRRLLNIASTQGDVLAKEILTVLEQLELLKMEGE